MRQALKLDPNCEEAAEVLFRTEQKSQDDSQARVTELLARAAGRAEDAKQALAELALLAPDDPRVAELLRDRK